MKKICLPIVSLTAGIILLSIFMYSLRTPDNFDIKPVAADNVNYNGNKTVTVEDKPINTVIKSADVKSGYDLISENSNLALYLNKSEADIAVKNKSDGSVWYSTPDGVDNDPIADDAAIMAMSSHLVVDFIDEKSNAFKANSKAASVRQETFKINDIPNGMIITFDFSRDTEQFIIPVKYELDKDALKVSILYDKIKEYGKNKITSIALLPYFGAGASNEEGSMLIPDGSGALVDFKEKSSTLSEYYECVYGRDPALSYSKDIGNREAIRLPVFGITKGSSSFVSVISGGAATAAILCRPVGLISSYGTVFSEFSYRRLDTTMIADKSWKAREVKVLDDKPVNSSPEVKYFFIGQGGYNKMAERVRQYLIDNYKLSKIKDDNSSVFINLYGAVKKTESVAGIIKETVKPVTTFRQAQDILESLNKNGVVNTKVILNAFNTGGYRDKPTDKISFDSVTGGETGYNSFKQFAAKKGTKVFYTGQIMNLYKETTGLWNFNSAAKTINGDVLKQYAYKLSTGLKDSNTKPWALLNYTRVSSIADKFKRSYEKSSIDGVVMPELSSLIYSNYDKAQRRDRNEAQQEIEKLLKDLSGSKKDLILSGGNMYSLPYAKTVINISDSDSNFNITKQSIPFYQMVCHGLLNLVSTPVNSKVDTKKTMLKNLEYGMLPSYTITGEKPVELQKTALENIYYSDSSIITGLIERQYKESEKVYKAINDKFITNHKIITPDFHVTEFENGIKLYINYGESIISYKGKLIKPMDFLMITDIIS